MTNPEISILTPSKNSMPYLAECISSVLGQAGIELEQIVMDGGSSDGTVAHLRSIPDHRLRWQTGCDRGPSDALNKAIKIAAGEIIGFCNADDRYCPGLLARVGDFFRSHPEAQAIYGDLRLIAPDGSRLVEQCIGPVDFIDLYYARYNVVPYPSAFIRRGVLQDCGGFDLTVDYAGDYDLFLRIAHKHGWVYLPGVAGEFRVHSGSLSVRAIERLLRDGETCRTRFSPPHRPLLAFWVPRKLKLRLLRHYLASPEQIKGYWRLGRLRRRLRRHGSGHARRDLQD